MNTLTSSYMVEEKAPLSGLTSFGIGGLAEFLVRPASIDEIATLIKTGDTPFILGGGSNLLISDEGISGVTALIGRSFSDVRIDDSGDDVLVHAKAGAKVSQLAAYLMKKSIAGFEFAYGLPGTIGGALVMNAGARGGEIKDVLNNATIITKEGEIVALNATECRFGYRVSAFPKGSVITEATLKLRRGEQEEIHRSMRENQIKRKATQPLEIPSAGSVFKNPPGDYAGRLIESVGLKGRASGGAIISEKHANFIVNEKNATAQDVYNLIRLIEKKVYEETGVTLEREIRLVGKFHE